jgi:hypothetical protein
MDEVSRQELLRHWAVTEERERTVLVALSGVLSDQAVQEALGYLDHNELGLALESLVAALVGEGVELEEPLRNEISSIASSMGIAHDLPPLP